MGTVIAKYAGHVRQNSGDVRQRAETLPDTGFETHTISDKENKNDHRYLPVINCEKCMTGAQNVRQSADGLPDHCGYDDLIRKNVIAIFKDISCFDTK